MRQRKGRKSFSDRRVIPVSPEKAVPDSVALFPRVLRIVAHSTGRKSLDDLRV